MEDEMPGKNLYTVYRGYRLYVPMAHDLLRDSDGRYAVYVVLSRPWTGTIERFVVPRCFAPTLKDAQRLSVEHAKRLVDGWTLPAPAESSPRARWKELYAD
jgi:glutathionyl-hydroquinone reductase